MDMTTREAPSRATGSQDGAIVHAARSGSGSLFGLIPEAVQMPNLIEVNDPLTNSSCSVKSARTAQ